MRIAPWLVLSIGCGGGQSPTDAGPDPHQPVAEVPAVLDRNVDVLFVVDDSGSMADKQQNLADNFPNFVNVLAATVSGGFPDLHLGVVSTDMGTLTSSSSIPAPGIGTVGQGGCANTGKSGNLQLGQAVNVTGSFISDIKLTDGTRDKNYTGDLSSTFANMAKLGATGCGFEQPLAAMRAALDNNPANAGFLRPDAALVVVFLTDEDDCSVRDPALFGPENATVGPLQSFRCTRFGVTCTDGGATSDAMNVVGPKSGCSANPTSTLIDDVTPFRDFLLGLKSDPRKIIVGGIIGNAEPVAVELRTINGMSLPALAHSCSFDGTSGLEVADPGVRMQQFLDQFPGRSATATVCQNDLSSVLADIGQLTSLAIGTPCLTAPLADSDPATPGLQPDCIVEDVVGSDKTPIPPCPASPTCFSIVPDAAQCPAFDNLRIDITRETAPDPTTVTTVRCLVE